MALMLGIAEGSFGLLLLIKAVSNASWSDILHGKAGQITRTEQAAATGSATPTSSPSSGPPAASALGLTGAINNVGNTAAAVGNAPSGGSTVIGDVTTAMLDVIGAAHGWSGQQIDDWENVIKAESNGTITDTNSSSGAYGIAQMLATGGSPSNLKPNLDKYYTYGGNPDTVMGQLTAMANYIAQRYGNPSTAWAFHLANGYY